MVAFGYDERPVQVPPSWEKLPQVRYVKVLKF
jgi:hypothetical protein